MRTHLVLLFFVMFSLSAHCPPPSYNPHYLNVTKVSFRLDELQHSPNGVQYRIPENVDEVRFVQMLDEKTVALEKCLGRDLHLEWFAVIVPENWYKSQCTGQLMIPSNVDYRLCEQKKMPDGTLVKIPVECREVIEPTDKCPCPCNFRSIAQVRWAGTPLAAVITAPDLKLYKAELARLVTGVNNVWTDKDLVKCVRN